MGGGLFYEVRWEGRRYYLRFRGGVRYTAHSVRGSFL